MARLNLNLPNDLAARLQSRASEAGFASVEEYAQEVLRASAEEQAVDEDIESMLLQRLSDARPGIEFNDAFRAQFAQQVQQRRRATGT